MRRFIYSIGGHFLLETASEEVADLIRDFMERVTTA